jgi:hypothetical protein
MANRLEQEFPETGWRATLSVGARSLDPDLIRRGVDRGRRLRNQAIRTGVRRGIAALARTTYGAMACGRRAVGAPDGPRSAPTFASPAHGA